MDKKYLYCLNCKKYPDNVDEVYTHYVEHRQWDGECYATVDTGQDFDSHYVCGECGTDLDEK